MTIGAIARLMAIKGDSLAKALDNEVLHKFPTYMMRERLKIELEGQKK